MATAGTNFTIVGGCETDALTQAHFKTRTGAQDFGSIGSLIENFDDGFVLLPIHVMASTMPCRGRSRLVRLNCN